MVRGYPTGQLPAYDVKALHVLPPACLSSCLLPPTPPAPSSGTFSSGHIESPPKNRPSSFPLHTFAHADLSNLSDLSALKPLSLPCARKCHIY